MIYYYDYEARRRELEELEEEKRKHRLQIERIKNNPYFFRQKIEDMTSQILEAQAKLPPVRPHIQQGE